MPSRRTNNFPESGRGRGHVTPTIFGSTVGYPSDSLASCLKNITRNKLHTNYDTFIRPRQKHKQQSSTIYKKYEKRKKKTRPTQCPRSDMLTVLKE